MSARLAESSYGRRQRLWDSLSGLHKGLLIAHLRSLMGYDEPETLSYAISSNCPKGADGAQERIGDPPRACRQAAEMSRLLHGHRNAAVTSMTDTNG